ncbi:hypothetical protein NKR23_g4905 [Pleurostoma richardsiae]|uniref:Nephrocystin 3-like N-terminal domain-containing protein n=1 Tax=Pleurostoma richardsiae TaxID=41990 RepID=A0AA38RH54_9PEZI|nr:hypothetical protein NKR23_g4905 [Pleurostoma richardsiae]
MALALRPSSSSVQVTPSQALQEALTDFQSILSSDQRQELSSSKDVPDADAVLVFTARLDASSSGRKGRSIASNLYSVLQSVRDFSAIIDTFVSAHPDIAALVWGSIKLTMRFVTNFASYYEAVARLFIDLGSLCPRFTEYQALYPTSLRLQRVLCDFHASIIRCCKHLVEAMRRPWQQQVFRALWESFEQEFKPDTDDIRSCSNNTPEFERWTNKTGPPLLWCSGKIGSGKTILTASVIDHILADKLDSDVLVTFSFPRFDDDESLKAETVIRCVTRQAVQSSTLTEEMEARLNKLDRSSGISEVLELLQALVHGADGMFLWVTFQIDEICSQHCDSDIRKVINNPPKGLKEGFARIISRIISKGNTEIACKIFRWTAAAKRSLHLDELGEIIFVEIGQPYSMPERQCNDIFRATSWCENLVEVDEESKAIQFAHHTKPSKLQKRWYERVS